MSDEIRPPPFPPARDETTEPGIGMSRETIALRKENARLRSERNEALAQVPESLPPPTRTQKAAGVTLSTVQWLGVASLVLTAAAQIASAYRPGLVGPIQHMIEIVKGLQ